MWTDITPASQCRHGTYFHVQTTKCFCPYLAQCSMPVSSLDLWHQGRLSHFPQTSSASLKLFNAGPRPQRTGEKTRQKGTQMHPYPSRPSSSAKSILLLCSGGPKREPVQRWVEKEGDWSFKGRVSDF